MDVECSLNSLYRIFIVVNKRKYLFIGRRFIEVVEDFKVWLFFKVWFNEYKKSFFEGFFEVDGNEIDNNF